MAPIAFHSLSYKYPGPSSLVSLISPHHPAPRPSPIARRSTADRRRILRFPANFVSPEPSRNLHPLPCIWGIPLNFSLVVLCSNSTGTRTPGRRRRWSDSDEPFRARRRAPPPLTSPSSSPPSLLHPGTPRVLPPPLGPFSGENAAVPRPCPANTERACLVYFVSEPLSVTNT